MANNIFNIITGLFLSKLTILLIDAIALYLAPFKHINKFNLSPVLMGG